jgi:hypothetical protein
MDLVKHFMDNWQKDREPCQGDGSPGSCHNKRGWNFSVIIVPQQEGTKLTVIVNDSVGNVSEAVNLTVISSEAVQSIAFGNEFYKVGTNGRVKFSIFATLNNGKKIDITDKVNLTNSNPEILAFTKDGYLKGLKGGNAVISAEYEGHVVVAKVQVLKGDITIPRK